jgi:hypothetical protein
MRLASAPDGFSRGARVVGAVAAVTEEDGVQVLEQDLVLGAGPVQPAGQNGFLDLAREVPPAVGIGQLHVLLGDGRSTLDRLRTAQVGHQGPETAPDVDAPVVVEVAVLDGHHRFLEHGGNVLLGDRDALVELVEGGDQVAVAVIDLAGRDGRDGLRRGDGGRQRQEDQDAEDGDDHRHGDPDGNGHQQED